MVNIIKSRATLEGKVFDNALNGKYSSPKIPAIVFSGADTRHKFKKAMKSHDKIVEGVVDYARITKQDYVIPSGENVAMAKLTYDALNNSKFSRYEFFQPRFYNAVLSQANDDIRETVGDCRTLSYLTGTVSKELGVKGVGILFHRDHMCNVMNYEGGKFRIENVSANGFNEGTTKGFTEKPLDFIVPYQLFSIGALKTLDDPRGSIKLSSMALELDSNFPDAYINRAIGKINIGKNASARRDLDKARDLGRGDDELFFYIGKAHGNSRHFRKGIKALTKAIDFNEKYPGAHLERGRLFYKTGDFNNAINDLSFEIENGTNHQAFYLRGLSHMKTGNNKQALMDFEAFRDFEEKRLVDYYIWKTQKNLQNEDAAKAEMKRFLKKNTKNAKKFINSLKKSKNKKITPSYTPEEDEDFTGFGMY